MEPFTKWQKWMVVATLITAIGTCVLALSGLRQAAVMNGSLEVYKEEMRLSLRPLLEPSISQTIGGLPTIGFETTEDGSEKWQLYYYVFNTHENDAYNLGYYHELDKSETLKVFDPKRLNFIDSDMILSSGTYMMCGYDPLFRAEAMESVNSKNPLYRHLYIEYEDEMRHEYIYGATWKLTSYQIGQHPEWLLLYKINLSRDSTAAGKKNL